MSRHLASIVIAAAILAAPGCAPNGEAWVDIGAGLSVAPAPAPERPAESSEWAGFMIEHAVPFDTVTFVRNGSGEDLECTVTAVEQTYPDLLDGETLETAIADLGCDDSTPAPGYKYLRVSCSGTEAASAGWYYECGPEA